MKTMIFILALTAQLACAQTWVYLYLPPAPTNLPGDIMLLDMTPAKPRTLYGQTIPAQTGWHSLAVVALRQRYGDDLFQQRDFPCLVHLALGTASTNVANISAAMAECYDTDTIARTSFAERAALRAVIAELEETKRAVRLIVSGLSNLKTNTTVWTNYTAGRTQITNALNAAQDLNAAAWRQSIKARLPE